jgi:hypothetical protein
MNLACRVFLAVSWLLAKTDLAGVPVTTCISMRAQTPVPVFQPPLSPPLPLSLPPTLFFSAFLSLPLLSALTLWNVSQMVARGWWTDAMVVRPTLAS